MPFEAGAGRHTSSMSSYGWLEATRIVPASAADIFELLATPAKHPLIDGSDTVLSAQSRTPERLSAGAKFGMNMRFGGRYKILNHVVEFEEGGDRLAAFRRPHLALPARTGGREQHPW